MIKQKTLNESWRSDVNVYYSISSDSVEGKNKFLIRKNLVINYFKLVV